MKKFIITLLCFLLYYPLNASANNLTISNVSLEDRNASAGTMVVQFDLRWDHSWRKDDGRKDAAWVFVKIYKNTTAPWIHGKLKTAGTNPVDTYAGSNADTEIIIPSDKIGAFIQRKATGSGTFSSNKIKLNVDLNTIGVSSSDTIQAKVFGIEMVYIPTGPFYIGDGNGTYESLRAFHLNGADNTAVQITTAGKSITVDSNASDDIDTSPVTVTGGSGITGNTSWPNGYSAFYLMKYLITQQQYKDFLNCLTRAQQIQRVFSTISGDAPASVYVMSDTSEPTQYRNSIRAPASGNGTTNPITFGCDYNNNSTFNESDDGQNLVANFITQTDIMSYSDWAGLRPITELEFEKSMRGSSSSIIYFENAWGSSSYTYANTVTNSGRADESVSEKGPGLVWFDSGNATVSRAGFSATNISDRLSAAAGYYGTMDLNYTLAYASIVFLGNSTGRSFAGTHGDGTLTTTASYEGNATNNDWPGIDATTARGITGGTGTCHRFTFSSAYSRFNIISTGVYRGFDYLGRCARTAP